MIKGTAPIIHDTIVRACYEARSVFDADSVSDAKGA